MSEPALDANPAAAIATAVEAIGNQDFSARFMAALNELAGSDLCSAFLVESRGRLRCLLASGTHPEIPDFAQHASLRYATHYWRRDLTTRRMIAGSGRRTGVQVIRQPASKITDPEYRRDCYEQGEIVERVTIYRMTAPQAFASAYRTRRSGPFTNAGLERLRTYGPLLIATVVKHDRLQQGETRPGLYPSAEQVAQRLLAGWRSLSLREAEISAHLLVGRTQKEIAAASGLGVSSVVTYRQRAYRKLGVSRRRDLVRLYNSLPATGSGSHSHKAPSEHLP